EEWSSSRAGIYRKRAALGGGEKSFTLIVTFDNPSIKIRMKTNRSKKITHLLKDDPSSKRSPIFL
ncbi:hypothetical protein, partial [Salmonella enterica]|uniref:hypothetical protein n=1 Tax=Salmonella enterica TaxID=28901 RepID=UPI001F3768B1